MPPPPMTHTTNIDPTNESPLAGELRDTRKRLAEVTAELYAAKAELASIYSTSASDALEQSNQEVVRLIGMLERCQCQITETHAVLDADESKITRNAKDDFHQGEHSDHEFTLAERVKALCLYAADWKNWTVDAENKNKEYEAIPRQTSALDFATKQFQQQHFKPNWPPTLRVGLLPA
jgi:hypothetical protein